MKYCSYKDCDHIKGCQAIKDALSKNKRMILTVSLIDSSDVRIKIEEKVRLPEDCFLRRIPESGWTEALEGK